MPARDRMMRLNIMSTMPDDNSVIKEDTPGDRMDTASLRLHLHLMMDRELFFPDRCRASTPMLMAGASPVAKAAPDIPMEKGNMNR